MFTSALFSPFYSFLSVSTTAHQDAQQILTKDWLHAFMYATQSLYPCYVSVPYIGQDWAYNVFTRDFNSCLPSAEYLHHSLWDKDSWSLSLHDVSPICLVFHSLLQYPWGACFCVRASISIYLSIYASVLSAITWSILSQTNLGFVQVLFLLAVFLNKRCSTDLIVSVIKLFLTAVQHKWEKQTRNTSNLWELQQMKGPGVHTVNVWAV